MAFNDHEPITLNNLRGYYARFAVAPEHHFIDDVPQGYLSFAENYMYVGNALRTRFGFSELLTLDPAIGSINRIRRYQKIGLPVRYLILDDGGNLFDTGSVTPNTPILTIAGMVDFAVIVLFDRAYISPHDRTSGLENEFVYVYDGSGVARKAGSLKPATSLTATEGAVGKIEAGKRLISYAYETASGFITKYADPVVYDGTGLKKAELTDVSIGPLGTIARYIMASPIITDYDDNPNNYELFFVPEDRGGKIADNVGTVATIDFIDSELLDSADYLNKQLEEIPAGLAFCEHETRLVSVGEFGSEATARISNAGDIESFNATSGFVITSPGDGGGLKNCLSHRGSLYLFKSKRTFVTSDNGEDPSTWAKPVIVDSALGTEASGIGDLLDSRGITKDQFFIVTSNGLFTFAGAYSDKPLTYNIEADVNSYIATGSEVLVDPNNERIYLLLEGSPSKIYVGDFSQGLSFDIVRWTRWHIDINDVDDIAIKSIQIDPLNQLVVASSNSQRLFKLDPNAKHDDASRRIETDFKTGFVGGSDGSEHHLDSIRVNAGRLSGNDLIRLLIQVSDASHEVIRVTDCVITGPKRRRQPDIGINAISEKFQLRILSGYDLDDAHALDSITFYTAPVWS